MARKTKAEKQLDAAIEAAFNKYGNMFKFDIMDLGKIHDETAARVKALQESYVATYGHDAPPAIVQDELVEAMKDSIEKYAIKS